MSIPLRAVCCAATMTLALAPGIPAAHAEHARSSKIYMKQAQKQAQQVKANLHLRQSRAALNAQLLAGLQLAVRRQRTRLVGQWQRRADRAVRFATGQLGTPYRWGGTGRGGYDCSGLVQRAWLRAGVAIPRVTYDQYRRIRTKVSRQRLRPGDLVLFNGLGHVGMYLGRDMFVHSPRPGRHVTVEPLRGYWQGRIAGAVRPAWPQLPEVPTSLY